MGAVITKSKAATKQRAIVRALVKSRSEDFQRYWETWMTCDGRDKASRWMAGHIGGLDAKFESLSRRIARLERKTKTK